MTSRPCLEMDAKSPPDPKQSWSPEAFAERDVMEYALRCSVDLQRERFDDRRPESNIGCEGPPEFFGV
jgi:hypothetical protein